MDQLLAMRQFVSVVDAGSFSAAARLLNVGQPAVSKTIAALEDHLGVRLLVRTTRSHSVTHAGERFYERARRVLDEVDEAEKAARDESTALTGRLRVAAPPVYASSQIIPRLAEFTNDHPDLSIDFVLDDRLINLVEEGVDVGIRAGELRDSSLVARRIDTSHRLVVGAPTYLEQYGEPKLPAELARFRVITYAGFRGPTRWSFKRGGRTSEVLLDSGIRVSAAEALRAAILAGLGYGVVSSRMMEAELASGQVRQVLKGWTLPTTGVWAIYPAGRRPPAKATAFVEWLAKEGKT
ncbi:MAG: LysR substrate-binding domain-containing protein [Pseudomonadota bacterium]